MWWIQEATQFVVRFVIGHCAKRLAASVFFCNWWCSVYLVFDMIMLMVAAVVCFVAIFLAVSVVSIVSVLLKRIVMVCWMDIVAYNHPVKSITRKGLSADLSFLSAGLRFFLLPKWRSVHKHAVPGWPWWLESKACISGHGLCITFLRASTSWMSGHGIRCLWCASEKLWLAREWLLNFN